MINNEEYATCPYNESHRILKLRLAHHLIKCQKNSPKLAVCAFNASHRFPENQMIDHIKNCPNRKVIMVEKKENVSIGALTAPKPLLQKEYLPDNDPDREYWDD